MYAKPDKKVIGLMRQIASDAQLVNFILFGGAPIDSLLSFGRITDRNDIDIAIRGLDAAHMCAFENSVIKRGYRVLFARRPYQIQRSLEVFSTYVRKGRIIIDANFMENPENVGLFNIDSLYIVFPSYEIVDAHGCLEGLKEGKISLIRSITSENAYLLASRFIYLSAKYSIRILSPGNTEVAGRIVKAMKREAKDPSWQFNSFLSSLLNSTLKSSNRVTHLRELLEAGFFGERLPELEAATKLLIKSKARSSLKGISDINDIILALLQYMPDSGKESFRKRLLPLARRAWENRRCRVNLNTIL